MSLLCMYVWEKLLLEIKNHLHNNFSLIPFRCLQHNLERKKLKTVSMQLNFFISYFNHRPFSLFCCTFHCNNNRERGNCWFGVVKKHYNEKLYGLYENVKNCICHFYVIQSECAVKWRQDMIKHFLMTSLFLFNYRNTCLHA